MILGHYGVALAAKRVAPRTSLGMLTFAAQWLDELWPILLLLGVERVSIVPGLMKVNGMDMVHYPWSHSLLMAVVWSALIGGLYFAVRKYGRGAWVVAALVLSHWILDAPMHRPDMPLWPGSHTLIGFSLWNSIHITLLLEFVIFTAGMLIYTRATRALDRIGSWGLAGYAAFMPIMYLASTFGAPPKDAQSLAIASLSLWMFVPLTWWIDKHREAKSSQSPSQSPSQGRY